MIRQEILSRRVLTLAKVICLVGFPSIPALIYLARVHPGLPGPTGADQVRQLAEQAIRWTQVHFAFSVAGFLGLATLFILRGLAKSSIPLQAATAVGLVGGVIFTGTVLMEVSVVPELSLACRSSPGCLSSQNAPFTEELADQGWRVLPGLTLGGRTMMIGLALVTAVAFWDGALRTWEALLLFAGSLIEIALDTGLHAWGNFDPARGMPGLAAMALLLGGAALSVRLVREAWALRPAPEASAEAAPQLATPAPQPPPAT